MNDKALNILLVEDDQVDVMNVRRAFDKNRIANPLFVAGDGAEGLAMLRSGQVPRDRRIVLLDLNMPRMTGIEFLRELRADAALQHTPVVVLTTSNDERDIKDCYQMGANTYVQKPVTFDGLIEAIKRLKAYWFEFALLPKEAVRE